MLAQHHIHPRAGCTSAKALKTSSPTLAAVIGSGRHGVAAVDERVLAALAELPLRQRQVIALRIFLDLDTAATAEALDIATGLKTVERRWNLPSLTARGAAAASFGSFTIGALIPLSPFLIGVKSIALALVLAGIAAMAGGAAVAKLTDRSPLMGGIRHFIAAALGP